MSDIIIFQRDDNALSVGVEKKASEIKEMLLAESALLPDTILTDAQNQVTCDALAKLDGFCKLIESSRKAAKEPVLEYGRTIDAKAREFADEIMQERLRLNKAVSDYAALLLARQRAQEAQLNAAVEESVRKNQAELALAKTLEERDDIQARQNAEAASVAIPLLKPAEGQRIDEDWDFEVVAPALLWGHYPHCIDWKPRVREIKALLKVHNGQLPGVKATKVAKSHVAKNLSY